MARPGYETRVRTQRAMSGQGSDTGTAFFVGLAERGPTNAPVLLRSMADFERHFGGRVSWSVLWDCVDVAFRTGCTRVYVQRVVGPGATVATVTLDDAGAADSIAVDSKGEGALTGFTVAVVAGLAAGTFRLVIAKDGVELERSYDLAAPADAVIWSTKSPYVNVRALGANDPAVVGATGIAGGNDQRGSLSDTERAAALARIPKGLGPGQVAVPGVSTTTIHAALAVHARVNNRWALWDGPDSSSDSTHNAAVDAIRASGATEPGDETYGFYWRDWLVVPGLVRYTTRTVPPSAVMAGLIAKSDAETQNPNIAAAGDSGVAEYVLGLSQAEWSDAVREASNARGVNQFKTVVVNGRTEVRAYGFRSAADPDDQEWNGWLQATSGRLRMAILHQAGQLGERFVFDQIDGRRQKVAEFGGAVSGDLLGWYQKDALFGETSDDAYVVDTGDNVNTDDSIADGFLKATIGIRTSPFAELVWFDYVKVPSNQQLAA